MTKLVERLRIQLEDQTVLLAEFRTMEERQRLDYEELLREYEDLKGLKGVVQRLESENSELFKENEEFSKICEDNVILGEELGRLKEAHGLLRDTATSQENEIDRLEKENTELKKNSQLQEDDLDKFVDMIDKLREEVSTLTDSNRDLENRLKSLPPEGTPSVSTNPPLTEKLQAENKELREKNTQLNSQAKKLAEQLTILCDQADRAAALQENNLQLAQGIQALESDLEAREVEIDNLLMDHEQMVLKLESFGVKVELSEQGVKFSNL